MSAFPSKDFSAIVLLCVFLVCVESQDFCESYERSNYSMIVFSHSNDTILLIVDKHFWRLREKDKQLVFDRKDFQASNSSEQWVESNYTFANGIYDLKDRNYRGIVLMKDMNNITQRKGKSVQVFRDDYYDFLGNYFRDVKCKVTSRVGIFHQKRFSFPIPGKQLDYAIIQLFNKTLNQLVRTWGLRQYMRNSSSGNVSYTSNTHKLGFEINETIRNNDVIHRQVIRLYNFTNIPVIGSYLNSMKEILIFFRIENDIKYCTIDECIREEYKVLISCGQKIRNLWIFVVITVVALVVFVIITTIFIYCIKERKTHPTTVYKSERFSTVQTLDSETGLPKDKSENDMSIKLQSISSSSVSENSKTNVKSVWSQKNMKLQKGKPIDKKVSPLKQQKSTTPAKASPKKSPKLKK